MLNATQQKSIYTSFSNQGCRLLKLALCLYFVHCCTYLIGHFSQSVHPYIIPSYHSYGPLLLKPSQAVDFIIIAILNILYSFKRLCFSTFIRPYSFIKGASLMGHSVARYIRWLATFVRSHRSLLSLTLQCSAWLYLLSLQARSITLLTPLWNS